MTSQPDIAAAVNQICLATGRLAFEDGPWLRVDCHSDPMPSQGWKLHVSAGVHTALDVVERTLPVILENDVAFKVISSVQHLAALNSAQGGISQIGKFITVYPRNDHQAVDLAIALNAATQGLAGPVIPFDRALVADGLVHYRFGGFGNLKMRTPLGDTVHAIVSPQGRLEPDNRNEFYVPNWLTDPFAVMGLAAPEELMHRVIKKRYAVLTTLHASPRSKVYLCFDLMEPKKCVIKQVANYGSFEVERLKNEYQILSELIPDCRFPKPYDLFESSGKWSLVMEDVEGDSLQTTLSSLRDINQLPTVREFAQWATQLTDILSAISERGIIHGDLKPANIIVTPNGDIRVIDFDSAWISRGGPESLTYHGGGTRGFISPQRRHDHIMTPADDIYSLGAVFYSIATSVDPSLAPEPMSLLDRPVRLLNPEFDPTICDVIQRCLAPDPASRFDSPDACKAALQNSTAFRDGDKAGLTSECGLSDMACSDHYTLAVEISNLLCDEINISQNESRPGQSSHAESASDSLSADINLGYAGAVMALCELVAESGSSQFHSRLYECADRLRVARRHGGSRLPGLYVGEAGIAAALLLAGTILNDGSLVDSGLRVNAESQQIEYRSPDVFNGTAGRVRANLWFYLATSDTRHLDNAVAAGMHLLATADWREDCTSWTIPPGYGALSGRRLYGYAHGAAGIGDTLLDLYETTHDEKWLEAAEGVGRLLKRLAVPCLRSGEGLNWPSDDQSDASMAYWCHGAAGVARFLLQLNDARSDAAALDAAIGAARTVYAGTRWSSATQCHGLAGSIECLLDVYKSTDDTELLNQAVSMAALLPAFLVQRGGRTVFVTHGNASNPGFSHGSAGVVSCLLRLSRRAETPHLLSLRGFDRVVSTSRPSHR